MFKIWFEFWNVEGVSKPGGRAGLREAKVVKEFDFGLIIYG